MKILSYGIIKSLVLIFTMVKIKTLDKIQKGAAHLTGAVVGAAHAYATGNPFQGMETYHNATDLADRFLTGARHAGRVANNVIHFFKSGRAKKTAEEYFQKIKKDPSKLGKDLLSIPGHIDKGLAKATEIAGNVGKFGYDVANLAEKTGSAKAAEAIRGKVGKAESAFKGVASHLNEKNDKLKDVRDTVVRLGQSTRGNPAIAMDNRPFG